VQVLAAVFVGDHFVKRLIFIDKFGKKAFSGFQIWKIGLFGFTIRFFMRYVKILAVSYVNLISPLPTTQSIDSQGHL